MSKTVICRSCGAEFSKNEPSCPYCGTMYLPAAENAYMQKLEDVRGTLNGLNNKAYKETKFQLKKALKFLFILLAVFGLTGTAGYIFSKKSDEAYEKKQQEEYLWRSANFPVMEELYESGDYDGLYDYYTSAVTDGHNLYRFKHYQFISYIEKLKTAGDFLESFGDDSSGLDLILHSELELFELEYLNELSDEDFEYLSKQRKPYLEDFYERFDMSDDELDTFKKQLKNGYISYTQCDDYLKKHGYTD